MFTVCLLINAAAPQNPSRSHVLPSCRAKVERESIILKTEVRSTMPRLQNVDEYGCGAPELP